MISEHKVFFFSKNWWVDIGIIKKAKNMFKKK